MRFSIATAYLPPEELAPLARTADELGYHTLFLSDHVVNLETLETSYPYSEDGERRWGPMTPWLDPWITAGALGAITENLRFSTNVYVLPLRDPFTVAKALSTASVLTGGRITLGAGMGWCEEEFDLLGRPFRRRGARADEMIELIGHLLSGEWTEFRGEFFDVPKLEMNPPAAAPVPVYIGGISDVALRRAARNDGWISDLISTDEARDYRVRIDEERERLGRSAEDFAMCVSLHDAIVVDQFAAAADVGVTDLITMPWVYYGGFDLPLEAKIDGMHRFAEEVMAHFAP